VRVPRPLAPLPRRQPLLRWKVLLHLSASRRVVLMLKRRSGRWCCRCKTPGLAWALSTRGQTRATNQCTKCSHWLKTFIECKNKKRDETTVDNKFDWAQFCYVRHRLLCALSLGRVRFCLCTRVRGGGLPGNALIHVFMIPDVHTCFVAKHLFPMALLQFDYTCFFLLQRVSTLIVLKCACMS